MSDPSFEQLVLSQLTAIKDDVNRSSDRHEAGMKKLFDIHEAHAADDIKRFDGISEQFTELATKAAESKGEAKATAKIWGLAAGLPAPIAAGIWAVWKAFHKLP
jgi:hypothetical protein